MPAPPLPGPIASHKLLPSFTFSVLTHKNGDNDTFAQLKYEGKVCGTEPLGKWSAAEFLRPKVKLKTWRGLEGASERADQSPISGKRPQGPAGPERGGGVS